jgi:NitT/TauT family transport system permease protein
MNAFKDPPIRPEYELALAAPFAGAPAAQAAAACPRLRAVHRLRLAAQGLHAAGAGVLWEGVARWYGNDLLLPGLQTGALVDGIVSGELFGYVGVSLAVLLQGYLAGIAGAFLLTSLAVSNRLGRELLETLTSMFNPLPAIALLPLACCGSGWARAAWCSC